MGREQTRAAGGHEHRRVVELLSCVLQRLRTNSRCSSILHFLGKYSDGHQKKMPVGRN